MHIVHTIILGEGLADGGVEGLVRGVGNAQHRGTGGLELGAEGGIVLGEVGGYKYDVHGVSSYMRYLRLVLDMSGYGRKR